MSEEHKECVNCEHWEGCSGFYLANMAKKGSRRDHKLDEWRVGFMDWIKTLPYPELIFGEE